MDTLNRNKGIFILPTLLGAFNVFIRNGWSKRPYIRIKGVKTLRTNTIIKALLPLFHSKTGFKWLLK